MSIILDALKKAQEERKRITQTGFPRISAGKTANRQRLAFYVVAGGLVCLILIVLFFPFRKKPAQVQTAAVKSSPVVVAAPVKTESPAKVEPPPMKAETKISVPANPPVKENLQSPQLKKQPETLQKAAAYVPKRKARPKQQLQDTRETMLPQEDTKVVVRKADDEKIMNAFNEAIEETKNGRLEVAKGLYLGILEEKPDYVEALNNLGVIAMRQDNLDEALSAFRKCLGYKKDYAKAYNNIGLVMMTRGDTKVAEEYFRKSIEMDRDKVEPYLNLAAIMRSEKRYDEASKLLESLVGRQVRDASLYLSLAIIKDETGKYNDAIQYYRYHLGMGGSRGERNNIVNRLKILEEKQATTNR